MNANTQPSADALLLHRHLQAHNIRTRRQLEHAPPERCNCVAQALHELVRCGIVQLQPLPHMNDDILILRGLK